MEAGSPPVQQCRQGCCYQRMVQRRRNQGAEPPPTPRLLQQRAAPEVGAEPADERGSHRETTSARRSGRMDPRETCVRTHGSDGWIGAKRGIMAQRTPAYPRRSGGHAGCLRRSLEVVEHAYKRVGGVQCLFCAAHSSIACARRGLFSVVSMTEWRHSRDARYSSTCARRRRSCDPAEQGVMQQRGNGSDRGPFWPDCDPIGSCFSWMTLWVIASLWLKLQHTRLRTAALCGQTDF